MKRAVRAWLIVAASLFLVGALTFVGAMAAMSWDFTRLSTKKFETNEYNIEERFESISADIDTADLHILPSDDGKVRVVFYEEADHKHSATVVDGELKLGSNCEKGWLDHIGISFVSPKITLYMPMGGYEKLSVKGDTGDVEVAKDFTFSEIDVLVSTGDVRCFASATDNVKIKASTGHISAENIKAGSLELAVSTGDISIMGVECKGGVRIAVSTGKTDIVGLNCTALTTSGSTGDISMKNVVATEAFDIKRTTGDVKLDGCDAPDINVRTDTGDVVGTLLSNKIFTTKTSTGRVVLPDIRTGGSCSITTSTGDIIISIA